MDVQIRAVGRGDPRGFLPAMLQRVKAQIRQLRRFRMAEDAEHAAMIVEMIVVEVMDLLSDQSFALDCFLPERFRSRRCAKRIQRSLCITG